MASLLSGESSHHGAPEGKFSQEKPEEGSGSWYLLRKELEETSPSRQDGIDLKKETYFRKSYCTYLQDLGMRLKVPQVTIATAIIFCHRFFLRQSHAKNDRRTVATVCMFLAGKVEETPRPLKDVILVSYEIIHKKDAAALQMIKQKEVYEQQKELILLGERVVLGTLGFDLNLQHPYKPLVEAIKKFKVAQNALAQVAWNFVNDGLRTSLCLQFKPHHIAAGAIFLAAKFLKVKLPSDGEKVWWQEFDVTPRQLEEVSNQMLELYEQNRVLPSQASEAEGSAGGSQAPAPKPPSEEKHVTSYNSSSCGGPNPKPAPSWLGLDQQHNTDNQTRKNNYGNCEINKSPSSRRLSNDEINETCQNKSEFWTEGDDNEPKDKHDSRNLPSKDVTVHQSPQDGMKKLDKEKLKAAFERRKARGGITRKVDPLDELERELEDVEIPGEREKAKHEKKQSWPHPPNGAVHEDGDDLFFVEDGEVEPSEEVGRGYGLPKSSARKRKSGSPLERDGLGRVGYSERGHKRHLEANHV